MNPLAIWKVMRTMPPIVRTMVEAIIMAVARNPDPYDAAKRALEELGRERAFDEAMRRRR